MKPNVTAAQLGCPDLSADHFEAVLSGHEELAANFLQAGASRAGVPKVVGVGITQQVANGRATGEPALVMLVDKLPRTSRALPARTRGGIPIVLEQVGGARATMGFNRKYRPTPGGVSIAPVGQMYAGTMACVVSAGGKDYILSTGHVLSGTNTLPIGTPITQPAMDDGGRPGVDVIANLSYYLPIHFGGSSPADAGMARIADGVQVDPRMLCGNDTWEALARPVTAPIRGMNVQKSGRTTGLTSGRISAIGLSIMVEYWPGGACRIDNAFSIQGQRFATGGDSGALVTTSPSNQPVGLLFASSIEAAYASDIRVVLAQLSVAAGEQLTIRY